MFQFISENINFINLPNNWYSKVEYFESTSVITFHILSTFKKKFIRHIEKQIVLTQGTN